MMKRATLTQIFIYLSFQLLWSQTIQFNENSREVELINHTPTSQEFTVYDNKGKLLLEKAVLASGHKRNLNYDDSGRIYKGVKVKYIYSRRALSNDIQILDRNIEVREDNRIWRDLAKGLFYAADEYFTDGFFSKAELAINSLSKWSDPSKRAEVIEDVFYAGTTEAAKANMSDYEKAFFSGLMTVARDYDEDDPVIIKYMAQQEALKEMQKTAKEKEYISKRILDRIKVDEWSVSASMFTGHYNFKDRLQYRYLDTDKFSTEERTYSIEFRYKRFMSKEQSATNFSFGPYLGYDNYPTIIAEQSEVKYHGLRAGLSLLVHFGDPVGLSLGINGGANGLFIDNVSKDSFDKIGYDLAGEVSLNLGLFNIKASVGGHFRSKAEEEGIEILAGGSRIGIEIPFARNYRYTRFLDKNY